MRIAKLETEDLLAVWEDGHGKAEFERMLILLDRACPQDDAAKLAALPLGQRDQLLMDVRETALGGTFALSCTCPHCRTENPFSLTAEEARQMRPPRGEHGQFEPFEHGGHHLQIRPLNAQDLAAIPHDAPLERARALLIERAVRGADGAPVAADSLPELVLAAVERRLEQRDPLYLIIIPMHCTNSNCKRAMEPVVQIPRFMWWEITEIADETLEDVHILAAAYHWSERDILALSPARRAYYVDKVRP